MKTAFWSSLHQNITTKAEKMYQHMKNSILGTVTATMIAISSFTFTPAQAGMMQDIESAQQKARTTLPDFWKKLKAPASGEKNFALMIKHQGGHMWLGGISRNGNQITGIVDK